MAHAFNQNAFKFFFVIYKLFVCATLKKPLSFPTVASITGFLFLDLKPLVKWLYVSTILRILESLLL